MLNHPMPDISNITFYIQGRQQFSSLSNPVIYTAVYHQHMSDISFQSHLDGYCWPSEKGALQIRGPQLFNSLPVNIHGQTGCSMTSFKHKLDKYLQNIPDKPKIPGYTLETDTNSITSMRSSWES